MPSLADRLEKVEPFNATTAEEVLRAFSDEAAVKAGLLINASRTMLTGQAVGPSMFEVFDIWDATDPQHACAARCLGLKSLSVDFSPLCTKCLTSLEGGKPTFPTLRLLNLLDDFTVKAIHRWITTQL